MGVLHTPLGVASLVGLINLPFGWWRAGVRRRSAPRFLAIHIPVLLSIGLRLSLPAHLRRRVGDRVELP